MQKKEMPQISIGAALGILGSSIGAVLLGMRLKVGMLFPMVLGIVVASIGALFRGMTWDKIQEAMVRGVQEAVPAIVIMLLVGMTIGLWIASGTVPTLIWYGLKWMSPAMLLPLSCLVAAIASTATGTSFGTIGTVGLALMGIGEAVGVPRAMMAGAIVSGAYFGDKMSPLSDTTNVAPAVAGTTVFEHIGSMVYTTAPAMILTLGGYYVLGRSFATGIHNLAGVEIISDALLDAFKIGILTLVPAALLIALSIRKVPAIPGLAIGIAAAAITAVVAQGMNLQKLARIAVEGYVGNTGNQVLDKLISRGGLNSMLSTCALILTATALGGILRETGAPRRLVEALFHRFYSDFWLVVSTIVSCYVVLLASGNQMLGIIIPGQMFKDLFAYRGLHPKVLSRTLEDAGTLGAPLVPWSTASLFIGATLGVGAIEYAPYAILNWITPIIAGLYAAFGVFIFRSSTNEN
ncbi:MAG TPA: Na+/H+ antiporter NhaC [Firmicutes bacterium]|nr:Na+/H+ antiporter NhaC [Candidatus Fermentithermobacillaceae bacterium]